MRIGAAWWRANRDADLFAGAHAPVHLVDEPSADHLEQNNPRTRVEDLLAGRAIALVLHVRSGGRTLPVHAYTEIRGYVEIT